MADEDIFQIKLNTEIKDKQSKAKVSFYNQSYLIFSFLQRDTLMNSEERKSRTANVSPGRNDSLNSLNNNILIEGARQPNDSMVSSKIPAAAAPNSPSKKPKQPKKKIFDPSTFKFHKKDYNFRQEAFIEQFYDHKKANKLKINQQLVE